MLFCLTQNFYWQSPNLRPQNQETCGSSVSANACWASVAWKCFHVEHVKNLRDHKRQHLNRFMQIIAGGKYLMHPYSTTTDQPNNWVFSPCSTSQIYPVLLDKSSCFVSVKLPYCGDGKRPCKLSGHLFGAVLFYSSSSKRRTSTDEVFRRFEVDDVLLSTCRNHRP